MPGAPAVANSRAAGASPFPLPPSTCPQEPINIPPEASSALLPCPPSTEALVEEFDLLNGPGNRFDEPSPLQLEPRGVTPQTEDRRKASIPEGSQPEFWAVQTSHKFSIAAKLREAGRVELAEMLEDCHAHFTFTQCVGCGRVGKFPNRCDHLFCPECQPRLARERQEAVRWWVAQIRQPKHVVLTLHNVPDLTRAHVVEAKDMLARLRRQVFASATTYHWQSNEPMPLDVPPEERRYTTERIKAWREKTDTHHTVTCTPWLGGFYSLEITNERRGFHLHFHLLVDARSIGPIQLSAAWKAATRGSGYIVKVQDARSKDYTGQVAKYAVKGSQLATWTPDQIVSFIDALDGVRTFGVFGSLYGQRSQFSEWLKALRDAKPLCQCGCSDLRYYTEAEFLLLDLKPNVEARPRPPTPAPDHPCLPGLQSPLCHVRD